MVKLLFVFFVLGLAFNSCQSRADCENEILLKDLLGQEQCWRGGQSVFLILKSEKEGTDERLMLSMIVDTSGIDFRSYGHMLWVSPYIFLESLNRIEGLSIDFDTISNGHSCSTINVCRNSILISRIDFSCGSHGCGFYIHNYL